MSKLEAMCSMRVMVDVETFGLEWYKNDLICGIAIGAAEHDQCDFYMPFRHAEGRNLPIELLGGVIEFLTGRTLQGHGSKFDCHFLMKEGLPLPPALRDSIVAAHTANENFQEYSLEHVAGLLLGEAAVKEKKEMWSALRKIKAGKEAIYRLDPTIVAPYGVADIAVARQLYDVCVAECARWRLLPLLHERHEFLLELLRCEQRGILLDVEEVNRQIAYTSPRMQEYEARLTQMQKEAGFPEGINIRSPQQLKKWLNLPATNKQLLTDILSATPREDIQTLLDYREIAKAESTYFRPFLERRDANDRLHTTFKVHGTRTWRLSSSQPNLQNCSRDASDRVYSVRKCFKSRPGWFLAEFDYSSIEPRIAAHYSGDEIMQDAFRQSKDFYRTVAAKVAKVENINDEQRTKMKTTLLGTLYSMGSYKMAVKLGLRHAKEADGSWQYHYEPVWAMNKVTEQLEQFPCSAISAEYCSCAGKSKVRLFFEEFPKFQQLIQRVKLSAQRNGYIRNPITGAVRRLKTSKDHHKATNSLIQGTAAEILRRAFTALSKSFTADDDPQCILTVHDSILFEIKHDDRARAFVQYISHVMSSTTPLSVCTPVEVKIGHSLGNMGTIHVS